jgi:RNA polymerase sigma factor (sigma-70 family)
MERTYSSEAVLLSLENREVKLLLSGDDLDEKLDTESMQEQINQALRTLTPREEKIITMRFGIEDGKERTLDEIGEAFNICGQRVRQIEQRAMRKLRHPSRSRHLEPFLEGHVPWGE